MKKLVVVLAIVAISSMAMAVPTIDGTINAGEWTGAATAIIGNGGIDGEGVGEGDGVNSSGGGGDCGEGEQDGDEKSEAEKGEGGGGESSCSTYADC